MSDLLRDAGFKELTRISTARTRLQDVTTRHERTVRRPLAEADGCVLAEAVVSGQSVPHYDRAAMDGFAVRAEDTFGASSRAPNHLRITTGEVAPGGAVQVHTGSELPPGADAVVMVEHVEPVGDDLEVFDAVAEGENVAPEGEDVKKGQNLYEAGHRLRPSDLGLLKSTGVTEVTVSEKPRVAVIPTGEELVEADPEPGEVIETNGLTVSRLVERWGGAASYHDIVTDDETSLREAVEGNLDADIIVTTGGSSVGERDLIPEVIEEIGDVFVHGVALKPGHPVALGVVSETPVIMLPGYPVACIINAVQFLRPALKWAGGLPLDEFPTVEAKLERKIHSDVGDRTFVRVRLSEDDGERVATPTRASGSGVLSSVALADGWVEVPESSEGIAKGATVTVQNWEWLA
ncbi:gephyrin-like molybdotransferase Glp [Haladaptatus sp. DJG-WS-42]|uniref:molybdopterin molybdotransferase MoeA n=1 Tax=Haladaptatus sp. DJG-WS-42 TaxID=3120516 RepID=UPI0030CA6952